ncbi:ammonium transporter [Trichlorobacter ammonificans]|uniref:Ammonium transporter n=1 Tax=Trichlorobacter ammonificans TaxID=2916410 RepID=A0ABN8HKZ5_9BACT|nr:ammonium transporter [Trichlorobacter ammonificans]CAH2032294.1 ammonium transporter [Trichlorobacter ammonificans]
MKLKFTLTLVMMVLFASLTGISAMAEEKKDTAAAAVAAPSDAAKPADAPAPAPVPAAAEAAPAPVAKLENGDNAWLLTSSALVLFMLPGLALFYGGMVRSKNVLSTMMHSFVAMGIVGVQWFLFGYSLSFGSDIGGFVGSLNKLLLNGLSVDSLQGSISEYTFAMFQGMFAIITVALISGALAERIKFSAYCVFALVWTTLVYDPIAHWVWGGGWIAKLQPAALDFAGGTVVHLASGISALAVLLFLGKRHGFPTERMAPHSLPLTLLGTGILWFGWYGFNAGSAGAANGTAALAFVNTTVAPAAAGLAWMIAEWLHSGKPSALGFASGVVAGLVGITPAAGFVTPGWAVIIGAGAGLTCYGAILLKAKLKYDDSLDAFGVHGIGGTFGAIATGLVASIGAKGLIYGDAKQFISNIIAIVAAGAYAFIVTLVIAFVLDKTIGLRVEKEDEIMGLDTTQHSESGYNM